MGHNSACSVSLPRDWDAMDVTMGSATYLEGGSSWVQTCLSLCGVFCWGICKWYQQKAPLDPPVLASTLIGVRLIPNLKRSGFKLGQLHCYLIIWDHRGIGTSQSPWDQITQSGKVVINRRSLPVTSNKTIALKN